MSLKVMEVMVRQREGVRIGGETDTDVPRKKLVLVMCICEYATVVQRYHCLFTQQVYHYYTIKLGHSQVLDIIRYLGSDPSKLCGASTMV